MSNWQRASTTRAQLERLVAAGMLPARSEAAEWLLPSLEDFPRPPAGYVVSFVAFHERGFSVPAGRFIRAVLFQYGLQLQHLNPNGIQQMASFEALCEGYLGVEAQWNLFRYFFKFTCLKDGRHPATIGCATLRTKQGRLEEYIPNSLTSSNSGWHSEWFYLKNDPENPLLEYTDPWIDRALDKWRYGPEEADWVRLLRGGLDSLKVLHSRGVDTAVVIGGYHA